MVLYNIILRLKNILENDKKQLKKEKQGEHDEDSL